ncbi:MAG: 3-deoxy-manno-octulosonate cytidylyltransferase [Bacteroidota bacterium]|jgi:3-deoxy-manno-octulosonate cytidylyltransferase (CMP-KDO synthetase)
MNILGVIPARFASTRFPGKPLIDICGKSMIQRVYEQACKSSTLDQVVVATDDQDIFDHVLGFGGQAMMTDSAHQSGTDRCAEVMLQFVDFDACINIQGDEPLIDPKQIDLLGEKLQEQDVNLVTLIKKIDTQEVLFNQNIPKVICNQSGEAIYFSRACIPHLRGLDHSEWLQHHTFYKHIGLYGYRSETLQQITKLPLGQLEQAESLEQLRWIEHGLHIHTVETELETLAIDTPEDLEILIKKMSAAD